MQQLTLKNQGSQRSVMGCLPAGVWEKTQGRLEMETRDKRTYQGRKLRGGREATENGKNMRKMLYSGQEASVSHVSGSREIAGRFSRQSWQLEHAWE